MWFISCCVLIHVDDYFYGFQVSAGEIGSLFMYYKICEKI